MFISIWSYSGLCFNNISTSAGLCSIVSVLVLACVQYYLY